jgi:pantoate--beta-alanine ligase
MPIEIRVMPTVREPDGLAMSSRNAYLNDEERRQALCLHRALTAAHELYAGGERSGEALRRAMREEIEAVPLAQPDYVEVVDGRTLEPLTEVREGAVAVLAVRVGSTRLIDNVKLTTGDGG